MSAKKTEQAIYEVYEHQKLELLHHLLTKEPQLELESAMIYLRKTDDVHLLTTTLSHAGIHVDSIHGKKNKENRATALAAHKEGKLPYLVVTEASIRNMDIAGVKTIINVDFPELLSDYETQVLTESTEKVLSFANPTKSGGTRQLKNLEELLEVSFPRATAEGFSYDKHALKVSTRNKQRKSGPRSKPLQNKKSKLLKKKGR